MSPHLLVPLQRPRLLTAGDTVAVVAPAGPIDADRLARGVGRLEGWGLTVRVAQHVLHRDPTYPHLAGSDEHRALDFEEAWCAPDVRAVFAARGGFGAARMIDLLDWDRLRDAGPKILAGFSDITTLHQAVANFLGLVTLFAPMPATVAFGGAAPDDTAAEHLRATLFDPASVCTLSAPGVTGVMSGRAHGVLVGGTLSLIADSIGTPEYRPANGGVAVLEDIAEPAYRLDGVLTQLLRVGWFEGVRAVVLGSWTDCGDSAAQMVAQRLRSLDVPLLVGLPFGHCDGALTIPLGVRATVDGTAGTLTLEQPALA